MPPIQQATGCYFGKNRNWIHHFEIKYFFFYNRNKVFQMCENRKKIVFYIYIGPDRQTSTNGVEDWAQPVSLHLHIKARSVLPLHRSGAATAFLSAPSRGGESGSLQQR
jgi:hypothetical protein